MSGCVRQCGPIVLLLAVADAYDAIVDDATCGHVTDAWRVTPVSLLGIADYWTVREFHVYEHHECAGDPLEAAAVFSTPDLPAKMKVVDGDKSSWWQPTCDEMDDECDPSIGFSTAAPATGRCLRFLQCHLDTQYEVWLGCAPSLALQYRTDSGNWSTAIVLEDHDAFSGTSDGTFEDHPIHFPCPTVQSTPGPQRSTGGADAVPAALVAGLVAAAALLCIALLAGYLFFVSRRVVSAKPSQAQPSRQAAPAKPLRRDRAEETAV